MGIKLFMPILPGIIWAAPLGDRETRPAAARPRQDLQKGERRHQRPATADLGR
jgi:hypothetical protein